jgi:hypothetical protein
MALADVVIPHSLQIFAQELVARTTLVSISSLAMIFTPCFFRAPAPSKTLSASASALAIGTPDGISKVFNEARIEQQFILHLLQYLDVTRLEDEDDWIPTHGKHNSMSSSCSTSTTESSASIFLPRFFGSGVCHGRKRRGQWCRVKTLARFRDFKQHSVKSTLFWKYETQESICKA